MNTIILHEIKWCLLSSPCFFLITLFQFKQCNDITRVISGSLVTFSSILYHNNSCNKKLYIFDQVVIWPTGLYLLSYDYSLVILLLVSFSVYTHLLFNPLNDLCHCIFIHVPIILALIFQEIN
jgi:hypothetical protein